MRQLGQLRGHYKNFQKLDTELICVLREEKGGVGGLKKAYNATRVDFPIVNDLGAKSTKDYSKGGFHTYVIDKEGVIRAVLKGVKTKRPSPEQIMKAVQSLKK